MDIKQAYRDKIRELQKENCELQRKLAHANIIGTCAALVVVIGLFIWVAVAY